jgi:hypothetical protein
MTKTTSRSGLLALFGISLFALDSQALPPGRGGMPSGSCFDCDCVVTGTIGNITCGCPRRASGGSGCQITYTPGWGSDCHVLYGPCKESVSGFAP